MATLELLFAHALQTRVCMVIGSDVSNTRQLAKTIAEENKGSVLLLDELDIKYGCLNIMEMPITLLPDPKWYWTVNQFTSFCNDKSVQVYISDSTYRSVVDGYINNCVIIERLQ